MRIAVVLLVALGCSKREAPRVEGKVELIAVPPVGEVPALVAPEVARASRDGKRVLVYVGADWCEPCRKFHAAAKAGELDAVLGDLRFMEFDLDRDQKRLEAAGYTSEFVPLFAVPRDDGRASGTQTDGVQKADGGMVEQLVPRVRALAPL